MAKAPTADERGEPGHDVAPVGPPDGLDREVDVEPRRHGKPQQGPAGDPRGQQEGFGQPGGAGDHRLVDEVAEAGDQRVPRQEPQQAAGQDQSAGDRQPELHDQRDQQGRCRGPEHHAEERWQRRAIERTERRAARSARSAWSRPRPRDCRRRRWWTPQPRPPGPRRRPARRTASGCSSSESSAVSAASSVTVPSRTPRASDAAAARRAKSEVRSRTMCSSVVGDSRSLASCESVMVEKVTAAWTPCRPKAAATATAMASTSSDWAPELSIATAVRMATRRTRAVRCRSPDRSPRPSGAPGWSKPRPPAIGDRGATPGSRLPAAEDTSLRGRPPAVGRAASR